MLILAVVAALVSPFALLLRVLHVDDPLIFAALSALDGFKSFVADLVIWLLFGFILVAVFLIIKGRIERGRIYSAEHVVYVPTNSSPKSMVVVLTAYNDEEAVRKVVPEFLAQKMVKEVIVVDNNSRDATGKVAMELGARVVYESQQGYGYACIRGLREALRNTDAEVIVLAEGDGTFAAEDLRKFEAYIDQADMVLGTRVDPILTDRGSQMDYFFTWGNKFLATLIRLRFWDTRFYGAARLTDVGCTYRAIRREALEKIIDDLKVGGNHFSPHMIMVALSHKLRVIEIPITFRRRIGESKGASRSLRRGLKVGFSMLWHILTYRHNPSSLD